MNIKAFGLVVLVIIFLTGCSGQTPEEALREKLLASDDFRTCQDAHKTENSHRLESFSVSNPELGVKVYQSLNQELMIMAERNNITSEMKQALLGDAIIFQEAKDGFNWPEGVVYVSGYCVGTFGGWETD